MNGKLVAFGECMAELNFGPTLDTKISFSGDVYNSLVYASRWFPDLEPIFLTALGCDQLSLHMMADGRSNNIDLSFVVFSSSHQISIYSPFTDTFGDSAYNYWRNNFVVTHEGAIVQRNDLENFRRAHMSDNF